ncbi:MAG TPA: hypothetical protein VJJ83_04715, partial [Candidatus Babeliales bacterium]|nr:hypothetical protein [Candidatus Babeliales bacterium]
PDYLQLLQGLQQLPQLRNLLAQVTAESDAVVASSSQLLAQVSANLGDFSGLAALLACALNTDPEQNWLIKTGFNPELDAQRALIAQAQQRILALEQQEQTRLGINSLKIRYNQIYGYYLEVTKPNLPLVPPEYTRLQTLVNCERFISPALQSLQAAIVTAQSTLGDLEQQLFAQLKLAVEAQLTPLRKLAQAVATLDTLSALATVAHSYNYVCPTFNQRRELQITAGRHPLVAAQLGQSFIANDTSLTDQAGLWVITGPNMGGKSTYLRQVALISIMAQCGSFVPAAAANLALVDRIFTRIGAGDYLSQGKSTFLVEMEETALICQLATKNSLVILDEVGRGTSTFDGLAIAQAVIEYL